MHGEDVRRPLGLPSPEPVEAWEQVAGFFVARDLTVRSRTLARGLRLEADDGGFAHGDGPRVRGTTRALVMALAARRAFLDELDGDGVVALASR